MKIHKIRVQNEKHFKKAFGGMFVRLKMKLQIKFPYLAADGCRVW